LEADVPQAGALRYSVSYPSERISTIIIIPIAMIRMMTMIQHEPRRDASGDRRK
jgi:hypothetical protein